MDFNTYLQTVLLRVAPLAQPAQYLHGQIGMITELGELGDLLKRRLAYGKPFDAINLMEECGDYLWYYTLYCYEAGIGMARLDRWVAASREEFSKETLRQDEDTKMLRALATATAAMVAAEPEEALQKDYIEMTTLALVAVVWFLQAYGFTLEQCLVANDAKLEKRTGKAFNASRILNRDTEAEREILEAHGQAQQNPAAG